MGCAKAKYCNSIAIDVDAGPNASLREKLNSNCHRGMGRMYLHVYDARSLLCIGTYQFRLVLSLQFLM